jgi:hypothetical protein
MSQRLHHVVVGHRDHENVAAAVDDRESLAFALAGRPNRSDVPVPDRPHLLPTLGMKLEVIRVHVQPHTGP